MQKNIIMIFGFVALHLFFYQASAITPQRLLIISDTCKQIGGAEVVIDQIQSHLEKRAFTMHHMDLTEVDSIWTPWPNIRAPKPFGLKAKIAQRINAFKPDFIFIVFLGLLSYIASDYCHENSIPFTVFYPSRIPEILKASTYVPLRFSYFFVNRMLTKAPRILTPTASVQRDLGQRGIRNVIAWPHGVDLKNFTIPTPQEKELATKETGLLHRQRPFYLYVGRLSKSKNIQALLDLKMPGTKIFVGPEDFGYSIEKLKKKYPDALFVGSQCGEALKRYYHCSDIFMFASLTDTFGLVLIEALASGLPVVALDAPGPHDIIPHNKNIGYLAKTNQDLERFAIQAWGDVQAGKISAETCRKQATLFSWDSAVDNLVSNLIKIP